MATKPVSKTVLAQADVVLDQSMTRRKLVPHHMCLSWDRCGNRSKGCNKQMLCIACKRVLTSIGKVYLEVNGDLASEAAVAMLLGNGAPKPAKGGPVSVDNLKLSVCLALVLDSILDLGVCQDLIIQAGAIGMHLLQWQSDISTSIQPIPHSLEIDLQVVQAKSMYVRHHVAMQATATYCTHKEIVQQPCLTFKP